MSRRIGVYLIGEELLLGKRQDKHLAQVISTLGKRSLRIDFVHMIGDDEARIAELLQQSMAEDAWVISFGGIGATPDDRTRQAAAMACGLPIERHPGAVAEIEAQFGDEAYPNRIRMAELPAGCDLILNPYNRIPGFSVAHHHFVPGFPQMAWPMLDWLLASRYPEWRGIEEIEAIVKVLQARESVLVPLQEGLLDRHPGLQLSSLPRLAQQFGPEQSLDNWVELGLRGSPDLVTQAFNDMQAGLHELGLRWEVLNSPDVQD